MKTQAFAVLAGWSATLLASQAALITIEPIPASGSPGDSVEIILSVSDLTAGGAPSLGAYDLNLSFDPGILDFQGISFGDPGLGDQLALLFPSSAGVDFSVPGTINLYEISLDDPAVLDALQAGAFRLATLEFDVIGAGVTPLGASIVAFGDSQGDPISLVFVEGSSYTSVRVPPPIPEASTAWATVGLGLAAGAMIVRRRLPRPPQS